MSDPASLPRPSAPPSERTCLRNIEEAARVLDALLDPKNKGALPKPGGLEEWLLDGRRQTFDASMALLSLHDYLNELDARRTADREPPTPCSACGWHDSDGGCNCG